MKLHQTHLFDHSSSDQLHINFVGLLVTTLMELHLSFKNAYTSTSMIILYRLCLQKYEMQLLGITRGFPACGLKSNDILFTKMNTD